MHCNITLISNAAQRPFATYDREATVRYLYIGLIIALTAVVLLFKIQNLQTATVSLLVIGIYVLGMFTGGFVVSLVRGWVSRARQGG